MKKKKLKPFFGDGGAGGSPDGSIHAALIILLLERS